MRTDKKNSPETYELTIADLYTQAEEWANSIDFLSDEIRFLKKIMDNYLPDLDEELKERVGQVHKELTLIESERRSLKSELLLYLDTLDMKVKAVQHPDEVFDLKKKHRDIQTKYYYVNKLTRDFKDHLFSITEDVYGG